MTVLWNLYRRAAEERNALERVRHQLVLDLIVAREEAKQEREKAARAWQKAMEPCRQCEVLEAERDDALLRLDAEIATRVWLEGFTRGEVKP